MFNSNKDGFVNYPLFTEGDHSNRYPDEIQKAAISRLINKLQAGIYSKHKNYCLCGNKDNFLDEVIANVDMHAIPLNVVLCKKCGLIRSADVFDAASNSDYYRYEYRDINIGETGVKKYFDSQLDRGESFVKILSEIGIMDQIGSVVEIGCGSGGILYPFLLAGKKVIGFDYDENFLEYGKEQGMELHCLERDDGLFQKTAADLLIVSHVLEHCLNPKEELNSWIEKVQPGKYLVIEVPGLFSEVTKKKLYGYPVRYFQTAHVVQFFYRDFLDCFYSSLGLEVVYGDETATFVLKKPLDWTPRLPDVVFGEKLSRYPALVDRYLKESYFDIRYYPHWIKAKWSVLKLLEAVGIRKIVKRFLKRWKLI
jgi:SAM-dependent methyltransferase